MLNKRLKIARVNKGLSQQELADKVHVGKTTIPNYETGYSEPNSETLIKISKVLDVTINYLLGIEEQEEDLNKFIVPVFYAVSCGSPFLADDDIIDYEEIDPKLRSQGEYFGLKLRGSSMEPRFQDGDVVIVKKQSYINSGEIAIVRVNGDEATMKIVDKSDQGITLIATNPIVFNPKFYTKEQVEELPVTIVGKVVELRAKF